MSRDKREALAALEHEQWAHWTRYMLTALGLFDESGGVSVEAMRLFRKQPARLVLLQRWSAQTGSSYDLLSESEKDSDRVWADKVLAELDRATA
jgi:hypothetical protein